MKLLLDVHLPENCNWFTGELCWWIGQPEGGEPQAAEWNSCGQTQSRCCYLGVPPASEFLLFIPRVSSVCWLG